MPFITDQFNDIDRFNFLFFGVNVDSVTELDWFQLNKYIADVLHLLVS